MPLAAVEIYFSAPVMNKQWLWDKFDGTPDLGLTPEKIRGAFYPTNYEHWQYRRALNLFEDTLTDDINARGPPHMVRNTVQRCDYFKVLCLRYYGHILSEDRVRTLSLHNIQFGNPSLQIQIQNVRRILSDNEMVIIAPCGREQPRRLRHLRLLFIFR